LKKTGPLYNIKMVSKETGLTPATLRAWERRYGIPHPVRSSGGQRLYSEEEISLLKWLVARKKEGMSISRAISLWKTREIHPSVETNVSDMSSEPVRSSGENEQILENLHKVWSRACLTFNEEEANFAINKALEISTPELVCTQVIQKGLAAIGKGWYTGKVSVQQEHFASALATRHLNKLMESTPIPHDSDRILLICPPEEAHELVLLMLSFLLRRRGWNTTFLGANTPLEKLDSVIHSTMPKLVLSAAQTLPAAASLLKLAGTVNKQSVPFAFGGGIFNDIKGLSQRIPGFFIGRNLESAPRVIELLLMQHPYSSETQPLPSNYLNSLEGFKRHKGNIMNRINQILSFHSFPSFQLELANTHFIPGVIAALSLGDIHFLDYLKKWLDGLLKNYGLPSSLISQYYLAFQQAVQEQMDNKENPILEWLSVLKPVGQEGISE
jgi:DNA-binding transcriptional MerR regulator